jgi:hypothetical protein
MAEGFDLIDIDRRQCDLHPGPSKFSGHGSSSPVPIWGITMTLTTTPATERRPRAGIQTRTLDAIARLKCRKPTRGHRLAARVAALDDSLSSVMDRWIDGILNGR